MSRIKKVLSVLSVLLITGQTWALEIDLSKIKVDGSLEVKGQSAKNETDFVDTANDERSSTRSRLTLGVGGELTDGVSARVEAVRRPESAMGTGTEGQFGQAAQTAHGEQVNLLIQNAYVSMEDVLWGVNAKLGRMYLGSKDSLVGYSGHYDDDNMNTTGLDALALNRKFGNFDVNFVKATPIDTKTLGGSDYSGGGGRQYIHCLNAMTNLKNWNENADVPVGLTLHHATSQAGVTAGDNVNLGIYELNVGANLMENALKLGLDWGSNFGQRNAAVVGTKSAKTKFKGTLMAIRGMYDHEESGFSASAEIANASGDDNTAEPDGTATQTDAEDKSWHDLSAFGVSASNPRGLTPYKGYGEILGKSNAMGNILQGLDGGNPGTAGAAGQSRGFSVMALGVGYRPDVMEKKWKLGLDYITAKAAKIRPTTATAATGLTASATDINGQGAALSKDIGSEIDLHATYAKSENVSLKFGYAQFDPENNSAVLGTGVAAVDTVTKFFANASVRF